MVKKLSLIGIMVIMVCISACSKEGSGPEPETELSTELIHRYLESCDCKENAQGIKEHTADCEVPEISEKVETLADLYTSNKINKDGYAAYRYVLEDAALSGYFDEENRIIILDDYEGLTEEVLAILSKRLDRPRSMLTIMYLNVKNNSGMTADMMEILSYNENDPRQVVGKIAVKDMDRKNIRCLVQNYFIDKDGNILSEKIADTYFDGKKKLNLSKRQLEWAQEASEDERNMEMDYEKFMEYYNAFSDEQKRNWIEVWGVEY